MRFLRKLLLWLGILLVVFIFIIAILVFIFVNPNRLKAQIIHQVYVQTGIPIQIQGRIDWVLMPQVGLHIHRIILPTAKVQEADVYMEWKPLLSRKIKINQLFLKNLTTEMDKVIFKKSQHITFKSNVQINVLQQSFRLEELNINSENFHATGSVMGKKNGLGVQLEGKMTVPDFEGWAEFPVQVKNTVVHFKLSSNYRLDGDISAETLKVKNYVIGAVSSPFTGNNQQIRFTQIKGNFSKGQVSGQVVINNFLVKPRYQIDIVLRQINVNQLLHSDILSGPADVNAQLFVNDTLNGKINLVMSNGSLNYIDLLKQIREVRNFLSSNHLEVNAPATHFSKLTASGVINNNIFTNHDLTLQSPDLQALGDGTINLDNGQIDYILTVNAYGLKLPVKINGALNKPKVKVDINSFILTLPGDSNGSKKIDKAIHDGIKNLFGHHHPQSTDE